MYSGKYVVFTVIPPIRDSNNNYISLFFAIPYHTTPIAGNVADMDLVNARTSFYRRTCREKIPERDRPRSSGELSIPS